MVALNSDSDSDLIFRFCKVWGVKADNHSIYVEKCAGKKMIYTGKIQHWLICNGKLSGQVVKFFNIIFMVLFMSFVMHIIVHWNMKQWRGLLNKTKCWGFFCWFYWMNLAVAKDIYCYWNIEQKVVKEKKLEQSITMKKTC